MDIRTITEEMEQVFKVQELCGPQARQIQRLREKLERRQLTLAVIGQFKRGKTTLVNRILGKDLLPVGIVPITAAVTKIRYGAESAWVLFENGGRRQVELPDLCSYISEQENGDNRLGVAAVEVYEEADFLQDGLTLVDTPGVGSVHEKNSLTAYAFAEESDGVLFMLSVDSPINKIETEFLEQVKRYAGKFYFCVNKADVVDDREMGEYLAYCKGLLQGLTGEENIKLFPVSAKTGAGVEELKSAIRQDLTEKGREIAESSVRHKLLEILKNSREQIGSYREVLKMAPNVFNSRFEEMNRILETGRGCAQALGTEAQVEVTRLNEEKNRLRSQVAELFGIRYYFELEPAEAGRQISGAEYAKKALALYRELEATLNLIFLYKEENAYTVARRIEDLNILIRQMGKLEKALKD